jgi:hypothetical protein
MKFDASRDRKARRYHARSRLALAAWLAIASHTCSGTSSFMGTLRHQPAPLLNTTVLDRATTIVTFNAFHLIMFQMALVDLYPELLLWIASHLQRVDLFNVSLACKHLREATQSELYRDYSTPRRRILPLVKPLIERPELRKHVQRLQLGYWTTLVCFNPFNPPYWESQD